MTPNENWTRWTFASFAKAFDAKKQDLFLYVEGTDRATNALQDFAEFRLDGPRIKQLSKTRVRLEVTVNILIQSTMDDVDAYKLQRSIGIMSAAFTDTIIGYEYGDSGNEFACFERLSPTGQKIGFDVRINNFGIIEPTIRKQQATIQADYAAEITV